MSVRGVKREPAPSQLTDSELALVVDRNIRALLERRRAEHRNRKFEDRIAEGISRFTGSIRFVYLHLLVFGAWIVVNLGIVGLEPFDPSFVVLAMVASVEAIFLSTFVLINQNRLGAIADRRTDLDLQISLLSEHEITRLISLVSAIAESMHIESATDPELPELKKDVDPEKVLDHIEKTEREFLREEEERDESTDATGNVDDNGPSDPDRRGLP